MRFLLDENVHGGLIAFLKSISHEVVYAPKGIKNGAVFAFAQKEKAILITRDIDFLNESFIKEKHEGIIFLRVNAKDIEAQKRSLLKILKSFINQDMFKNKIIKLLPSEEYELVN